MNFAQCLLGINFLWLFAVFKMAEICERSERATENKKKRLGGNFKFSGCGVKRGWTTSTEGKKLTLGEVSYDVKELLSLTVLSAFTAFFIKTNAIYNPKIKVS